MCWLRGRAVQSLLLTLWHLQQLQPCLQLRGMRIRLFDEWGMVVLLGWLQDALFRM